MTFLNQVAGIFPALDRRQVNKPFVLDGQNFLVDAEGPFSAFGTQLVTYSLINDPEFAQTFRVNAKIFLFTADAIFEFDAKSDLYFPRFVFASPANEIFPWSQALVGGKFYFVKKGANVVKYDPLIETFTELTTNIVGNPYVVTQSGGRLIIITDVNTQWSAIDNGSDLAIDPDKKVGGQLNAVIGDGTPLGALQTFNGFLVYITTGLMKFTIVNAASPFRFDTLGGSELVPISPYVLLETENNEHIYLSKTGFKTTRGKEPTEFQPLMSEFFRRQILPKFDLTIPAIFRLSYNADRQWFIVSISNSEQNFKFDIAYVLYLPRSDDGWGIFNKNHTGFGELQLDEGPFTGFNFGYFDFTGELHKFVDFPHIEQSPDGNVGERLPINFYHYHEDLAIPSRVENLNTIFSTHMQMSSIDETVFRDDTNLYEYKIVREHISPSTIIEVHQASSLGSPNIMRSDMWMQAGLAELDWAQYSPILGSINSFIDVGLFRFPADETEAAEITLMSEVVIGMIQDPGLQESEDWLTFSPDTEEDWLNNTLPDEDWGIEIFTSTNYIASIIGSLDGYQQFSDQIEIMEERTDIVVAPSETTGRSKYFTCYNNGVYHIIRIEALEQDQSFHLKVIDLEPNMAGIL